MDDDLLALADREVRQLKEALAEALQELADQRSAAEALAVENADLYRRLRELIPPPAEPPLAGIRIAIIGHPSREADYREIVERLGGQLFFAPARDKLGLVDRAVQKAHGTLYITAWGSHKSSERATAAAARYGRPLILTDRPGLEATERAILEQLLPLIRPEDQQPACS